MSTICALEIVHGPQAGTRFRLEPGRTVVGRHPSCGIVLDAVSVSRQHAAIEIEGTAAWIEDLGSRNGTAVDGKRISARQAVLNGQQLRFGDQRLRFSSNASPTLDHLLESGSFVIGELDEQFAPSLEAGPSLLSRSLMERVVQSRQALLSADVSTDSRIDVRDSVTNCGIRSVMCVPFLRADGGVLGVLQLDRGDTRNPFQRKDLDLLAGVTAQVTLAIEQAQAHEERLSREQLRRELELANRVQQALLPSRPPEIPGYETFDHYEPARQISGDFFSYVPLPGGRTAVVLADVSGKGMPAGGTLVCYTDGISEALDHAQRPYGFDRLARVVAAAGGGAHEVGRRILADVERHAAGQIRSDDICLVCLGRGEPPDCEPGSAG